MKGTRGAMRSLAIYAGTFDPITLGHVDLIERSAELFERLILAVAESTPKTPLFTVAERLSMARAVVKGMANVRVESFNGLVVDYARAQQARVLIRGLRAYSDFEYEFQMALTNRKLAPTIDTVFLVPHERYTYLNSTIVREVARLGGDVSGFVPPGVRRRLLAKAGL